MTHATDNEKHLTQKCQATKQESFEVGIERTRPI